MFPLTIDDILDETNQPDASIRHKHWLVTEVSLSRINHLSTVYDPQCEKCKKNVPTNTKNQINHGGSHFNIDILSLSVFAVISSVFLTDRSTCFCLTCQHAFV